MQPAHLARTSRDVRNAVTLRVDEALRRLKESGKRISFYAVAHEAHVARSTLYRRKDLKNLVERARNDTDAAHREPLGSPSAIAELECELARVVAERDALANMMRRRAQAPLYSLVRLSPPTQAPEHHRKRLSHTL